MSGRCAGVALAVAAIIGVTSCASQEKIPNHPVSDMSVRVRSRIERIDLVIADPERAAAVEAVYLELEDLIFAYQARRAVLLSSLTALDGTEDDVQEKIATAFDGARKEADRLLERYVALQLRIRELVSKDEFARLDRLR